MALSAVERLRTLAYAKQQEDIRRKTVVLFSPIKIDLTASGLLVTHIEPFDLTPISVWRIKRRAYGKNGVAITTANSDRIAASGPSEEVLPGEIGPILTGAYGNRGLVEVPTFFGIKENDYGRLIEVNEILFPASLKLEGQDGAAGRFQRIINHLDEVIQLYGADSDVAKAAAECKQGVLIGKRRRESFFQELQIDAVAGPVPIYNTEKMWLDELGIRAPENVKFTGAQFERVEESTDSAIKKLAARLDQADDAKLEAMMDAYFNKRAKEMGLLPPDPEPEPAPKASKK